jgi:hypothetical protein
MRSRKSETDLGLTREDLVDILKGSNVASLSLSEKPSGYDLANCQQQESLACDAIG